MISKFDALDYGIYMDPDFRYRWLRPQVLSEKLLKFKGHPQFSFEEIGKSEENRSIQKISFGNGPIKILMWSQMHGNEPTATMAIIDLLSFLMHKDKYDEIRNRIFGELTLVFIPMLNPDGAERFQRRNAFSIDINRDALKVETAEMKIFMKQLEIVKPHYAFNLHDQRNIFSVGESSEPATISLLAPPYDKSGDINKSRINSIKLILSMTEILQKHYPQNFSRFSDEYYPRALGEYLQSHNISTILIESGGYHNDPFRDVARKMNYLMLIQAWVSIMNGDFETINEEDYHSISKSKEAMLDIIFKDCKVIMPQKTITTDIGLIKEEIISKDRLSLEIRYKLKDAGDLSFNYGYREYQNGTITEIERPELEKKCNFIYEQEEFRLKFENGRLYEEHKPIHS